MYLIYIIELRRKPLFSSLPTNKAFIFRQLDLIYYFTNIKNSVIKKFAICVGQLINYKF